MYVCGAGFGQMYFFCLFFFFLLVFCLLDFIFNIDQKLLHHLIAAAVLIAFTAYMAHLTTAVAWFLSIWTVAWDVTALVAIVAWETTALFTIALALPILIGTVASQMTGFVAIVAAWVIWWLTAVTSNVTGTWNDTKRTQRKLELLLTGPRNSLFSHWTSLENITEICDEWFGYRTSIH